MFGSQRFFNVKGRGIFALLFWVFCQSADATPACRQALVLGLDVSGSVDAREYRLQLDGLASALEHPEVIAAILAMPSAPVRLTVFEWSGPKDQQQILNWTELADASTLNRATETLRATTRQAGELSTGLGAAMLYGAALLDQQAHCWKRTMDISGDGKSNTGPRPREIRETLSAEIVLNGLVIGADAPNAGDDRQLELSELSSYYRAFVLHGPDAFVETALGFEDFEAAMVRKLLRELEGLRLSSSYSAPYKL